MNEKELKEGKVPSKYYCRDRNEYYDYNGGFLCTGCLKNIYFGGIPEHQLIGPRNINKPVEHHRKYSSDCKECIESELKITKLELEVEQLKLRVKNPKMIDMVDSLLRDDRYYQESDLEIIASVVRHLIERKSGK